MSVPDKQEAGTSLLGGLFPQRRSRFHTDVVRLDTFR